MHYLHNVFKNKIYSISLGSVCIMNFSRKDKKIDVKINPQTLLIMKNDVRYKELNLEQFKGSDDKLFKIIIENPRILERPIIVSDEKAVIGRPPENIFKLF